MNRYFFLLIYLAIITPLFAQTEYKGVVLDAKTNEPLPYVNIGILNKGVGTVSDEDGKFHLEIDKSKFKSEDVLQFSSVGYKTIQKKGNSISLVRNEYETILMQPEAMQLNEVVLSAKNLLGKRDEIVGFSYRSREKVGYWKGDGSLGAELVTKIDLNRKTRQLKEFYFYVYENYSDSVLVRVNIYKGGTIYPEHKILKRNVTQIITKKSNKITIDLLPYSVIVNGDFSIGLELLKVYGDEVGLVLAADDSPSTSYRRYASQDQWKSFRGDAMNFYVNTTVVKESKNSTVHKDIDLDQELVSTSYVRPVELILDGNFKNITGIVFNNGKALENVTVQVVGGIKQTQTDTSGRYSILAKVGDDISFDYLGMEQVKRKVLETTFTVNASLNIKIQQLDNVIVTERKKRKKTQEELFKKYESNPDAIKTTFGILDKNTASFALEVVDGSTLNKAATNLIDAIANQFSGVTVRGSGTINTQFDRALYMRGSGSILNPSPAIFEVDGTVYQVPPEFLDLGNIERIAKIAGLAATSRYGSVARGGIFIINTKSGNFSPKETKPNKSTYQTNSYEGDALSQEQVRKNWPEYLKELYACTNFNEAKAIFKSTSSKYRASPSYFLDAYSYFSKNWTKENFEKTILEYYQYLFEENSTMSKALAYVFQEEGNIQDANALYKNIFLQRPNYAQSYRDLANSYIEINERQKAANLYARYNKLLNEDFLQADVEGVHPIIEREFNTLVLKDGSDFLSKEDISEITANNKTKGIRLLFEWNDEEADFDLQFVNPQKKFFIWKPELSLTRTISKNKEPQSSSKEYFIDDAMKGTWQININYKGNTKGTPIYIKVTTYANYGKSNQKENINVYRIGLKNASQELFKANPNISLNPN